MLNTARFDVLIVYSEKIATGYKSTLKQYPFAAKGRFADYNTIYAYVLKTCASQGLSAAFAVSSDIVGPGVCMGYWEMVADTWVYREQMCSANQIFDKFSPVSTKIKKRRKVLFGSRTVKPFNDPYLFGLFFDKQKTYNKLSEYSLPTVSVANATDMSLNKATKKLAKLTQVHPNKDDFCDQVILKDRHGAGGKRVYKFGIEQTDQMLLAMKKTCRSKYIIQPFVNFERGFNYGRTKKSTDIRLVYLGGKVVQVYIRMAKKGDFRCNDTVGGSLKYLPKSELPARVIRFANKIAKNLKGNNGLFSLDFIISNNGNIYLLEGNTSPGLNWDLKHKIFEFESKKLINLVVLELKKRVRAKRLARPSKTVPILPVEFPRATKVA